jgi:hypothetical protein
MPTIKEEPTFEIDSFQKTKTYKGALAITRRIINLLLQEKGTHPDIYDMGIGLKTYCQEFLTPNLISNLTVEIQNQINTYIPDNRVASIQLRQGSRFINSSGQSVSNRIDDKQISILIQFESGIEEGKNEVILSFSTNTKTDEITSEIYF